MHNPTFCRTILVMSTTRSAPNLLYDGARHPWFSPFSAHHHQQKTTKTKIPESPVGSAGHGAVVVNGEDALRKRTDDALGTDVDALTNREGLIYKGGSEGVFYLPGV